MDDKAIEATLNEWATALEILPAELAHLYEDFYLEEQKLHAQLTVEQLQERALRRVRIRAKREHGPQAMVTGMADALILGTSGKIDNLQALRDEAITLFRENPKQAVRLGVTNEKGEPLDSRKTFPGSGKPNPFYAKPMRVHNYITIVTGLAAIERDEKREPPVLFTAILDRNAPDSKLPPVFHRVRFPITGAELLKDQNVWRFNLPRGVTFEDRGPIKDLFKQVTKYAPQIIVPLEQLDMWAASHTNRELVMVEGDVVRMDLAPVEAGRSRRLQIDNGHDIRGFGTTVWVHDETPIDFAEESKVAVFGNARAGNPDSGFGASVNAMGLYAHPEYRTALPEGIKAFPEPRAPPVAPSALDDITGRADGVFGTGEDAPMPPAQKVTGPATETEAFIFCCIAVVAKKYPAKGAHFDEVLSQSIMAGLNKTDVEYAINELLERTRIYETEVGHFKTLEEPTKVELAIFAKRGGK